MFTGIVTHQGEVVSNAAYAGGNRVIIRSLEAFDGCKGESIAVSGVCLTLLNDTRDMAFDLSPETLQITYLGRLQPGQRVNLERAMLSNTRFGGHYVSGHVDATVCLAEKTMKGDFAELTVKGFDKRMMSYLSPKGSITLDGVSLTINGVNKESISIMLVPHTLASTTLGASKAGDLLHVEFDYLTRVVVDKVETIIHSMIPAKFKTEV